MPTVTPNNKRLEAVSTSLMTAVHAICLLDQTLMELLHKLQLQTGGGMSAVCKSKSLQELKSLSIYLCWNVYAWNALGVLL